MTSTGPSVRNRRVARAVGVLMGVGLLLLGACSSDGGSAPTDTAPPALPGDAQAIVDRPTYDHGSWSWMAVDLDSGEIVSASQEDRVNFLGSTTKLITVGTYLEANGPDATFETPVYATGTRSGSVLEGDLVLVAKGDFVLGSRGVLTGDLEFESPDHVYWYATPTVVRVPSDPLAGLDELAAQVKASGITSVTGDVLVDDRLWEPYDSKEGVVTPIMVNDNLLDIAVAPGTAEGGPANLDLRPTTSYFDVVNQVTTTASGGDADVVATVDDQNRVVVSGEIPLGDDVYNTAVFADDPAAYARALFVEALERAGVTITEPVAGTLPPADTYATTDEVASLTSPPASVLAKLVLKTSHNRGAEALMCLLAVQGGSTDCNDGLVSMIDMLGTAGVDHSTVFIYDGEGSDPASAAPIAMLDWLTWADGRPWGQAYHDALPDLNDDGTILAKSGTSARPQIGDQPALFVVNGEAGYMTTASGRHLVVAAYANNGSYPTVAEGLDKGGPAVTAFLTAIQQAE